MVLSIKFYCFFYYSYDKQTHNFCKIKFNTILNNMIQPINAILNFKGFSTYCKRKK